MTQYITIGGTRCTWEWGFMKKILEDLENKFSVEISAKSTTRVERYLAKTYPEATWTVEINFTTNTLIVTPTFKNPADETFYRLKYG